MNYRETIRNKKVLVTGGLGFVGHNLVKSLVNDYNCAVTVVDNCLNSSEDVLADLRGKYIFKKLSVLDSDSFLPLLKTVDFVFHLACVQIAASSKNPILDLKVNAQSTLHILEYIRAGNTPNLSRFIYTSSCSVFGSSTTLPANEGDESQVLSNYAATKMLGESYSLVYGRSYQVPTSVIRYSNVYGYGQSPRNPYCGVLGKFIHNSITGKTLSVFGDGEQTRDYTFIDDAVDATILAAVHPRALSEVFNVGTSIETSVNQLVKYVKKLNPRVRVEHIPERDIDNIRRRMIGIEKIHQKLGWAPTIGIKRGLELTYRWYEETLS